MTINPDYSPLQGEHPGFASVEELARRKGIEHIKTIEELACDGVFDTDEEVEDFLAFVTELDFCTFGCVVRCRVRPRWVGS